MRRWLVGALGLALYGCESRTAPSAAGAGATTAGGDRVLATIDGTAITAADLERYIAKQRPYVQARYSALEKKRELLENLVRFEVMAREAEARGYAKDPEVVRYQKLQMVNQFVEREFDSKLTVEDIPEADAERYYRAHPEEFMRPEQVRVSQILVRDKEQAAKVAAAARALAPGDEKGFRELVAQHSEDEDSKVRGGDLTFFDRDSKMFPKALIEAAFALDEAHPVSDTVATLRGFHVLKLTQRRPGFTRPFPEVKRQIQSLLLNELRTKKLEEWTTEMKGKLKVEIYEKQLEQVKVPTAVGSAPAAGDGKAMP